MCSHTKSGTGTRLDVMPEQGSRFNTLVGMRHEPQSRHVQGDILGSHFSISAKPTLVVCDENGNEITRYVGQQTEATINNIFAQAVA